eukprot:Em0018g583a
MELANQEEPVRTIKRQYIHLDDVLPPLETLVVAIEGSVDPAGVCCLSVPNRLMDDWAKKNEENTSFVALLNEYIVDEAVTFDPEATRLEDLLYQSLNVHSTSGKMIHIHLTDDAASEKDDNMDLRVLYILDRSLKMLQVSLLTRKLKLEYLVTEPKFSRTSSFVLLSWDMSKPESHYSITKARTLDTISMTLEKNFATQSSLYCTQPYKHTLSSTLNILLLGKQESVQISNMRSYEKDVKQVSHEEQL